MSSVLLEAPDQEPKAVKIFRPMTTIGSSDEVDIRVKGAGLEPTHAHILMEGSEFTVVGMLRDMTVNGRRERKKRLQDRDIIRLAELKVTFYEKDEDVPKPRPKSRFQNAGEPAGVTVEKVSAYRRVHEFSMKLLSDETTEKLVETIIDSIVELTGADKGFLVLLEEGKPVGKRSAQRAERAEPGGPASPDRVPDGKRSAQRAERAEPGGPALQDRVPVVVAARGVNKVDIQTSLEQLSDSILKRVIETKKPLIVADALSDQEWSASQSVVALKLLSVMCCPLLERGEIKGVLYVGNNRVTNVFDEPALDAMNVFAAQASLLLSQAQRIDELKKERSTLQERLNDLQFGSIVGACDSMKDVFKRIRKVATADISVLITGETGTGKELIAREIHNHSRRVRGPFVVINCGAIPENLLESELFGHVRGAFTGAVANKEGRFQAANGGTLFLDEIGEMPLPLQVKLLRALQEHVVTRVGDTRNETVDIRVVAATNRVLEEEIKAGRFREDLYYRLNVVNVHLPPLRERADDMEILAKYFLAKSGEEHGRHIKGFTKSCLVAMRKYRWPGNVRELENRIKKATVLCEGPLVTAEDLDIQQEDLEEILPLAEAKERFQNRYINKVLERNGGNRTKTARDLGVDPRTIFRHLEKQQDVDDPIPPEDGTSGLDVDPSDKAKTPRF